MFRRGCTHNCMQEPPTPSGMQVRGISVLGLPCVIALLGLYLAQPPRPAPPTAQQFSAERAIEHSRRFAVEPRPAGSAALERARDYLVAQPQALGWGAELQETTIPEAHRV